MNGEKFEQREQEVKEKLRVVVYDDRKVKAFIEGKEIKGIDSLKLDLEFGQTYKVELGLIIDNAKIN